MKLPLLNNQEDYFGHKITLEVQDITAIEDRLEEDHIECLKKEDDGLVGTKNKDEGLSSIEKDFSHITLYESVIKQIIPCPSIAIKEELKKVK